MRDEELHRILNALIAGGSMSNMELVRRGAGELSVTCTTLERLVKIGLISSSIRDFRPREDECGCHEERPEKVYSITNAGLWFAHREEKKE